ncbi:DUF1837 domain-containing protein [Curtobacterium sp. MWU13-2055]|uniref:HamA C-terminal domain-containing protein n=1 Tax=Curtobacterium sp. MWU13-2055 TaxID=2931928 RepID=UPI00200ECEB0|nr:DUF1837 domain-containing protein [Curtobacterium sp. MWU13-2055]
MQLGDYLPMTLKLKDDFLALFNAADPLAISKRTQCHLHILKMSGGSPDLHGMYSLLNQAALRYALSRRNATAAFADPERIAAAVNQAQARFRTPDPLNGEGGELLLYGFLEGHLGAPKVLTKMELKTSGNDYVKGADGLHLLQRDDDTFELIFGESKMYGDGKAGPGTSLKSAIRAAFASMAKVAKGGFAFETWLINSELLKEVADDEALKVISAILLPELAATVQRVNSFGVMIGYEIDVTTWGVEDLSDDELASRIDREAADLLASQVPYIKARIAKHGLKHYDFHIYAVPFLVDLDADEPRGIEAVRMDLAHAIKNGAAA